MKQSRVERGASTIRAAIKPESPPDLRSITQRRTRLIQATHCRVRGSRYMTDTRRGLRAAPWRRGSTRPPCLTCTVRPSRRRTFTHRRPARCPAAGWISVWRWSGDARLQSGLHRSNHVAANSYAAHAAAEESKDIELTWRRRRHWRRRCARHRGARTPGTCRSRFRNHAVTDSREAPLPSNLRRGPSRLAPPMFFPRHPCHARSRR